MSGSGGLGLLEHLPDALLEALGEDDHLVADREAALRQFLDEPPRRDAEFESEARAAFFRALDDFTLAQRTNADRPESHVNLGVVNVKRGLTAAARRDYDRALELAPWFVPAWVNLADLLRIEGKDDDDILAEGNATPMTDAPMPQPTGGKKRKSADANDITSGTADAARGKDRPPAGGCTLGRPSQRSGDTVLASLLAGIIGFCATRRRRRRTITPAATSGLPEDEAAV